MTRTFWILMMAAMGLGVLAGCQPKSASDQVLEAQIKSGEREDAERQRKEAAAAAELQIDTKGFVPGPAPEFTFQDLNGHKVKLSSYKGKVVLLDFWATWCGPCRKGLPFTDRMNKELASRGLAVLAISTDELPKGVSPKVLKKFIEQGHMSMTPFWDPKNEGMMAFNSTGIPTTIILDKAGNIVAKEVGLFPQQETIDNLKKAGLDVSGFAPKNDPTMRS